MLKLLMHNLTRTGGRRPRYVSEPVSEPVKMSLREARAVLGRGERPRSQRRRRAERLPCRSRRPRNDIPQRRADRGLAARRLVVPPPRAQLFVRSLSSRKKPKKPVRVPELCSAERLAKALKLPLPSLLEQAEALGEPVADAGSLVSAELMELLAGEAGVPLNVATVDSFRRPPPLADERARLPARPPVVALMGHVDHGKTSMLDAFRGSQLAAAEAGGITQAISAFTVDAGTPSAITFLDTPGHELFAGMRARGARSTDVLLLVVALDAGVQATTREAIAYAKDAGLPMVVAANKYDREGREAAVKKLSAQLVQAGVLLEEMGGDVPLVPCSATKGLHLDDVRDALLLQAEL